MVTQARLAELFNFDPDAGIFTKKMKKKGGARHGQPVGTITELGYTRINCDGRLFYAHRLAWLWVTGQMPEMEIDHVNGNRSDNRIGNLRHVDHSTNQQNRRRAPASNKSTGVLGVYFDKDRGKYQAGLFVDGKRKSLGRFDSLDDASAAHLSAKRDLHNGCTL
jgi:hypothetical protein